MNVAILILTALAAVASTGTWLELRRARTPAGLTGCAVVVNTTGSTAVRGIVHADLPDRLTLREAVVLTVGRDAEAPAGGLLHVDRTRIDFVQQLPAAAAPNETAV